MDREARPPGMMRGLPVNGTVGKMPIDDLLSADHLEDVVTHVLEVVSRRGVASSHEGTCGSSVLAVDRGGRHDSVASSPGGTDGFAVGALFGAHVNAAGRGGLSENGYGMSV
jgi:hypothetical protein